MYCARVMKTFVLQLENSLSLIAQHRFKKTITRSHYQFLLMSWTSFSSFFFSSSIQESFAPDIFF